MTTSTRVNRANLIELLARELHADQLVLDHDVLASISRDQAPWAASGRPAAGVRVRSERDVSVTVRTCAELGVPVVARGAGTGLSGGANAVDGCVVLDFSRYSRILEVDVHNQVCVVQPGVVNDDLKAAVAEAGLWYPPDPASAAWSTIGGNVSTNAGGLCCVKYGVTRDYVLGLRAAVGGVAGYGAVVPFGRRTAKGVAGYDMAGLIVGAEGTLGIVTEVWLRLRPQRRSSVQTVVAGFASLESAGEAVAAVMRAGVVPAALELLDRTCLVAVEQWKRFGLDATDEALLLARVDSGVEDAETVESAYARAGAVWTTRSTDPAEAEALFEARRLAYPAVERLGPVLTEDVCVPRSQLAAMLKEVSRVAADHDLTIATIAHAGDGNVHPLILMPPGTETRALAAFEVIQDLALALGGTVTGEHGVGLLKRDGLSRELAPESLSLQRGVKEVMDPRGIFNPGKALPSPASG